MNKKRDWIINLVRLFIPLSILIFLYQKTEDYFKQLDWEIVFDRIPEMDINEVILIVLIGFMASGFMTYYDILFNSRLNLNIPFKKLIKYSWIANTFNNFFGFGGLAGASIRTALYRKHHPQFKEIIKTIAWSTPLMFLGVSFLLIFVLINGLDNYIHLDSNIVLELILWGIVLFLPVYLILLTVKKKFSTKIDRQFVLKMLVTSIVEWFSCFVVFFIISKTIDIPVSFGFLYGLFFVGKFVGVISMTPGGVGAFDFVILQGLHQQGVMNEESLLLVVLYRLSYFVLPWLIGFLLGLSELGKEWFNSTRKIWRLSEGVLSNMCHKIISLMVFMSGVVLLMNNFTTLITQRLGIARKILPDSWLELSVELSVVIGFVLILISRSVYARLKFSYYMTSFLLILGAIFTLSKGFYLEEAAALISIAILLAVSKKNFTRINYVLRWEELLFWIISVVAFLVYYEFVAAQSYTGIAIWHTLKTISTDMLLIAFLMVLVMYLALPRMKRITLNHEGQRDKIMNHFEQYTGTALSHMVYLEDKYIYWSKNEKVLFMYQIIADKIIVLGEPIGSQNDISSAIEEFQKYADHYGLNVVFYQVGKENLAMYHEKGYSFFKLGEESIVDLREFNLSGKKSQNLRNQMNKFRKAGYNFEVCQPPFTKEFMIELKGISNEWLGNRKEKGFSMGYFNEEYLQTSSVAVLKDEQGSVVAFANFTPVYDSGNTLGLDLMRYKTDTPIGTMDVLFCHILNWSKEHEYKYFNLRTAPLSNVGNSEFSFLSEKLAYKLFLYGSSIYGFAGLRKYKEKFTTNWEPKYLAYRKRKTLSVTLLQISLIIQKSKKVK